MGYSYIVDDDSLIPVTGTEVTSYSKKFHYDHMGRLVYETTSKTLYNGENEFTKIVFLYDEGAMVGFEYTSPLNETSIYYYLRNLQGDVIAIYDTNGTLKVKYKYDAWGNCTVASGTTDYTLARINPIRYRGYYFDADTGLYYLNARYYNPEWRRFISPDDTSYLDPETPNGLNLYVYCNNDPVNYADPSGHFTLPNWAKWIIGGVAFATAFTITAVTGGALIPMLVHMGASILMGGLIQGGINVVQGGNFWEGFADGAANGALTGGMLALGQSMFRVIKVAHYASNGFTIGKKGTYELISDMTKTSNYGGLKSHGVLKKLLGQKIADKICWIQNKSTIKGVMSFKGVIFDCGGELTGFYAQEIALTKGYEYLVNIWLL